MPNEGVVLMLDPRETETKRGTIFHRKVRDTRQVNCRACKYQVVFISTPSNLYPQAPSETILNPHAGATPGARFKKILPYIPCHCTVPHSSYIFSICCGAIFSAHSSLPVSTSFVGSMPTLTFSVHPSKLFALKTFK